MVQRVIRSPRALLVLVFGTILGAVWAAGPSANAAPKPGNSVSITAGAGIVATPNPITSTGTIAVAFGGNGVATTASRSDHTHAGVYLPVSGGTVGALTVTGNTTVGGSLGVSGFSSLGGGATISGSLNVTGPASLGGNSTVGGTLGVGGDVTFSNNAQLVAPRVQNSPTAPVNPAAGQLWWDTVNLALKYYDGTQWLAVPVGSSGSPILGVIATQWQGSSPINLVPTAATVSFNLASPATVVIEFGGEVDIQSGTNTAYLVLTPIVDTVGPPFPGDTAQIQMISSNNVTEYVAPLSKLIVRTLQSGPHTVTLAASISAQQSCTIRSPWLKVTRF
jgi:hypothetical protein